MGQHFRLCDIYSIEMTLVVRILMAITIITKLAE